MNPWHLPICHGDPLRVAAVAWLQAYAGDGITKTVRELADLWTMPKSSVARLLDDLERVGIIHRGTSAGTKARTIFLGKQPISEEVGTSAGTSTSPSPPPPAPPPSLPLNPPAPLRGASPQGARRSKACRIPEGCPNAEMLAWAKAETQGRQLDVDRTALQFRDYWLGKAGKDGAKLDWFATWRRWVRTELDRLPPAQRDMPLLSVVDPEASLKRHLNVLKSPKKLWVRDYFAKFVKPDELRAMLAKGLVTEAQLKEFDITPPRAPGSPPPPPGPGPSQLAASY